MKAEYEHEQSLFQQTDIIQGVVQRIFSKEERKKTLGVPNFVEEIKYEQS
jgi:hypothetical protein